MRLRALAKKIIFGSTPFIRGRFIYYGHTVHFPLGSDIFNIACMQGIYECDTLHLILSVVQPETAYFDVGANIGLLSLPVVVERPDVEVVSIEASPTVLPFLNKTHADACRSNWTVVGAAVGACNSEAQFWAGKAALNAYDGLRDTGRGGPKEAVKVFVRQLDEIWRQRGCPVVSVVKMDIEGGEYLAIKGAGEIISNFRPIFVLEWSKLNLSAYGINPDKLLTLCANLGYALYAGPNLIPIQSKLILRMAMEQTYTFILAPRA